jgi:hypothetical protein
MLASAGMVATAAIHADASARHTGSGGGPGPEVAGVRPHWSVPGQLVANAVSSTTNDVCSE